MSTRDALALFAGLGQGYMQQQQTQRQQDYEDEQRAYTREQQGRERDAYNLAQQTRQQLAASAAPAAPVALQGKADTADNIDVGTDATATAPTGQFNVNGQTYGNQADAQTASDTYNLPSAQLARMANVYAGAGDAQSAATLRQQARQGQIADLQLSKAQRDDIAEKFNTDMNSKVKTFDDLGDFVSNSNGDAQGGALKVKAVPSADGKTVTMNKIGDDGTLTPLGKQWTFSNDSDGLNSAKINLLQGMSTEQQLSHLHQQHQDTVAAKNADTNEQYRRDQAKNSADRVAMMLTVQEAKNDAAAARAEAKAGQQRQFLPPGVKEEYDAADKRSESLQKVIDTAKADPSYDPKKVAPGLQEMITQQAVLEKRKADILGKFGVGSRGTPSTPLGAYDPNNPGGSTPRAPTTPIGKAVAEAPPGSWVNPNAPVGVRPQPGTPAILANAPPLAIMSPGLRAQAVADEEARQRAAEFDRQWASMNQPQHAGMSH